MRATVTKRPWTVAVAAVVVYVAAALPVLGAPLRWDETEFPREARAVVERDVPKVTFAEDRFVEHPDAWIRRWDADYGLWHPPLYIYLLAVPMAIFGDGDVAVRSLGLVLGAAATAFAVVTARRLAERAGLERGAAVAATAGAGAAIATNPFWVFGTMRIDIDGALLSLLVLATVSAFALAPQRVLLLGALLLVLVWAKLPAFVLTLVALAVYGLAARDRRAVFQLGAAGAAAAAAFVTSWFAYCGIAGLPWNFPIEFTGSKAGTSGASAFDFANTIRFNVAWIGLPLIVLGLVAMAAAVPRLVARAPLPHDAFATAAAVVAVFYVFVWTEPGKYTVMLVPLAAVPAGIEAVRLLQRLPRPRDLTVAGLACALLALYVVVGDTVTAAARRATRSGFAAAVHDPRLPHLVLAVVVLAVAVAAARLLLARARLPAIVAGAAVALLPAQLALGARLDRHAHDSLVLAPKHESGFVQARDWLRAHVRAGDVIAAPKEFAYYLDRGRVIPLDRDATYPIDQVPRALAAGTARLVVVDDAALGALGPSDAPWRRRYALVRRIGSFDVFARRGDTVSS